MLEIEQKDTKLKIHSDLPLALKHFIISRIVSSGRSSARPLVQERFGIASRLPLGHRPMISDCQVRHDFNRFTEIMLRYWNRSSLD